MSFNTNSLVPQNLTSFHIPPGRYTEIDDKLYSNKPETQILNHELPKMTYASTEFVTRGVGPLPQNQYVFRINAIKPDGSTPS